MGPVHSPVDLGHELEPGSCAFAAAACRIPRRAWSFACCRLVAITPSRPSINIVVGVWRRERDSNPRGLGGPCGFQVRR